MAAYNDYLLYGLGIEENGGKPVDGLRVGSNPARAGRAVRFQVPPGTRRLTVTDVTGRTVADLSVDETGTLDWTPPAAPGTYLVRARGATATQTRPLVVVH